MDKWKKAVVHLECATDSEHFYDRIKRSESLTKDLNEGNITLQQFAKATSGGSRDLRQHGTAIFLLHDEKHYLITARHVLCDEDSGEREYLEEFDRSQRMPEHMESDLLESGKENSLNKIFDIIFRVPSFDEFSQSSFHRSRAFLMNLAVGVSWMAAYTFSTPELDIAVVSLSQRADLSRFADELFTNGYKPISLNDIVEAPSCEGAEIYTVGFPSSTAILGQINKHKAPINWSSNDYSLPTFSFGRVSMLHNDLPYLWANMSNYPGSSGGPVIENDKLVGIVSGQPMIPIEDSEEFIYRIPFGMIIKAKFINELILEQAQKDKDAISNRSLNPT